MTDLPPELEPWVEAMARVICDHTYQWGDRLHGWDDSGEDVRDTFRRGARDALRAVTVPSRTPCPTCEEVGLVATDGPAGVPHTVQCPACEGDGYVEGPSLWDQAVEAACEERYERALEEHFEKELRRFGWTTNDDQREHDDFVNEILANAPDSYDGDDAAEAIAIRYVRDLETHPRGLDLLGYLESRRPPHHRSQHCPGCGNDCATVGITRLAWAYRFCDCGDPEYTHVVEQLWHLTCLQEGPPDLATRELLDSAAWALEQRGPGSVARRAGRAERIRSFLAKSED